MKKLLALIPLMLAIAMASPYADAKKFGGGKKFGSSYKTAPAKQQPQKTDTVSPQPGQATPAAGQPAAAKQSAQTPAKKGMMGGLMGGLLAGGLLAALFAGGAFEGLQMMDMVIIALLIFGGVMLFKMMRKGKATPAANQYQREAYAAPAPSAATQHQYQAPTPAEVSPVAGDTASARPWFRQEVDANADDVPMNLPTGFDPQAFVQGATGHYHTLQQAWNNNDLTQIEEYVSPAIFADLVKARAEEPSELYTQVLAVNAEIVRADHNADAAQISLYFYGQFKESPQGITQEIKDIWHLERDLTQADQPWLIVGIE
ncbi:Tim44 domain-containing protein [Shewanella sp. NIFS-20-20]|uniref:Tim44 domain-containing protein n=1 Tax=Shewanella sp. NIFS-20-20 TaxID=2853806 RepID=UPI001C459AEF|nr:Tim44-like domain-containing protein [Shewanella sp. NIFS-20-20]MBV7314634.1 39S ribosomal protein L45 [Shewanella sp. NIFS-20-20]